MAQVKCPYCHSPVESLQPLDAELKVRMTAQAGRAPKEACERCIRKITESFGVKAKKRTGEAKTFQIKSKDQQKIDLWRSRVSLIREARERIGKKDFHKAVVSYEKYFRVLEIIYEVPSNGLDIKFFDNPGRAKEMVVLAGAFWDLCRIYDNAPAYKPRLKQMATKLAEFLPKTPICEEISEDVVTFRNAAKNPEIFDELLKALKKKRRRCFIATAAFQDPNAPTVQILAAYRDEVLHQSPSGRAFVKAYYAFSPPVALLLDSCPPLRYVARSSLSVVAHKIHLKYSLKSKSV